MPPGAWRRAVVVLAAAQPSCNAISGVGDLRFGAQDDACESPPCASSSKPEVEPCPGGGKTTLRGKVYDPTGKVPLHGAVAYVPSGPVTPIPDGASCDRCDVVPSGAPFATALTDVSGEFVLEDIPWGDGIPLVIQVGKWRRETTVPRVEACVDNVLDGDPELTSLPSNQSEGHLPKIAVTTGSAESFECLLRLIGIEDSEFSVEGGRGRVHLFNGGSGGSTKYSRALQGGATFPLTDTWWTDSARLASYDVLLLSCEGDQNPANKPVAALEAMYDYASLGGRVLLSHWHNYWLQAGPPPLPMSATFAANADPPIPFTTLVDTSFPKGEALSKWLVATGASTTPGQLVLDLANHTINAVDPAISRQWIYATTPQSVQVFTVSAPVGAADGAQCGRIVMSDIHASDDAPGMDFPTGCTSTELPPKAMATMFMLFDLLSCTTADDVAPAPPPTSSR